MTGLKDLIHILKHNRGKSDTAELSNKAYLSLCDSLFQLMRDQRSSYLRAKSKTTSKAMLPLAATALRNVLHAGVRTIKASTVELLVEGIIEILPGTDGTLLPPLIEDLPKALRALLEYQPHVERMSKECWDSAVDFSIGALNTFLRDPEPDEHDSWSTAASSRRARTPLDIGETSSKPSSRDPAARSKQIPDEFARTAEDFVHCLHSLTVTSNAPLVDNAVDILGVLVRFLQRKSGRAHSIALAVINHVLTRITLHSTELTKRTIRELLPLMKYMWSDPLLRDDIIVTLMHTEAHLASILVERHGDSVSFDVEALVETIYAEYRRRQESTVLQYLEDDHLCFRNLGKAQNNTHPLTTHAFSLGTEHVRCEGLWGTVSTIAHFSFMLDQRKRNIAQDRQDCEETLIKRLRITHHFQEYLRHTLEPRTNAKRAALQVIAFMVQKGSLDEEDIRATLEKLTAYITDENSVTSTWAMIGLAALVHLALVS